MSPGVEQPVRLARVPVDPRSGATAMRRLELSRPLRVAAEQAVFVPGDRIFDYGSGHGSDVQFLRQLGYEAAGWDPVHNPEAAIQPADVVHLGYVLNVIEEPSARAATLHNAWSLTHRALIVAVRSTHELASIARPTGHGDGVRTGAETFQKLFGQLEAREYLTGQLSREAVPITVGTFLIFRDAEQHEAWLERRRQARRPLPRRRRAPQPRKTVRDRAYDEYRQLLEPLEAFVGLHGRLPAPDELPSPEGLLEVFGSVPKAFQVIKHVADEPWWDAAAEDRKQELMIRFALARLRRRPKFRELPEVVRRDVKSLWGSYKAACGEADALLFSIADEGRLRDSARSALVGKSTPDAIYIHVDYLDQWPAPLRVLVGAASTLSGEVEGANLVKVHLDKARVSWLIYPDFETDPHPALAESWSVDLRELDVRPVDYRMRENPPVLHRKELFVGQDHPLYETFRRLTEQEIRHGLLEQAATIGTRDGWEERLRQSGWQLRGHRLVRA